MREEKVSKSEIGGRRMSRLRKFSKVAVDNKEVDNKEVDKNKVKKKEADNNRVSEVDTVGRRMSRLRRLGTWYSEADLHRLEKQEQIILSSCLSYFQTIATSFSITTM